MKKNPKLGRLPRPPLDVLKSTEINRLEGVARSERDKLIVRVLADTGIRVGELVRLTTTDIIDRDGADYLKVHGKGDKERLVSIYDPLLTRLKDFAQRGRRPGEDARHIFTSERRIPGRGFEPLTVSGVQQLIRELGEEAAIGRRVHPHLFRRTYITQLLIDGVPAKAVAENVGHQNMRMIDEVYSDLRPPDTYHAIAAAMNKRGRR